MANRYWVGGTGTWNNSATTHWSTTSGGASGASAPVLTDDVIFNANSFTSGSQTVTLADHVNIKSMNWTGVTNNPTLVTANYTIKIYAGDFTLSSGMTVSYADLDSAVWFVGRGGTMNITTNGKTIPGYRTEFLNDTSYSGSVFNIIGDLTTSNVDYGYIGVTGAVTINTNNYNVTTAGAIYADDTATLNLGTSTITVGGDCDFGYTTFSGPNLLTADNATLVMAGTADYSVAPYLYFTPYQTLGTLHFTVGANPCVLYQTGSTVKNLTIDAGATLYTYSDYGDPLAITNSFNATGTSGSHVLITPQAGYSFSYFNGTVTDPNSNWTNDANVADSSASTFATATSSSTTASNYIQIAGTSASAGNTTNINLVEVSLIINGTGTGNATIYTSGLAENLGTATSSSGTGSFVSLSTPSGGWTWTKINALVAKSHGSAGLKIAYIQVRVSYERPAGTIFTKSPSTVRGKYLTLKGVGVTGGAVWYAYSSTDNGGNTGWTFANATAYNVNDGGFITA